MQYHQNWQAQNRTSTKSSRVLHWVFELVFDDGKLKKPVLVSPLPSLKRTRGFLLNMSASTVYFMALQGKDTKQVSENVFTKKILELKMWIQMMNDAVSK